MRLEGTPNYGPRQMSHQITPVTSNDEPWHALMTSTILKLSTKSKERQQDLGLYRQPRFYRAQALLRRPR
jgi:hypothetical protein